MSEIAFGVSRDSISRSRAYARNSSARAHIAKLATGGTSAAMRVTLDGLG